MIGRRSWSGALLVAVPLAGCGHRPSAPADALDAFAAAVERREYDAAYALMSSAFRARVSRNEFRARLKANERELAGDARTLREAARRAGERVAIPVAADEQIDVVREGGTWRLDDQPLDPYGQATPRAALRAFVRAIENRRYDVLLRLAPARHRPVLTPEKLRAYWEGEHAAVNRALLRELRLALDGRIAEEGDEALMPYGAGRQVRFVREEGAWRIESPE